MNENLLTIARIAVKNPEYDSVWQSFGFDKRPSGGGFFSSKPDWKKKLENRITLHIIYTSIACSLIAEGLTSEGDIREIVEVLNSLPSKDIIFEDAYECINFYSNNPTSSWLRCMMIEFKVSDLPDNDMQVQLSSGISLFCAQSKHAIEDMSRRLR